MRILISVCLLMASLHFAKGQKLTAGPMVGHVTERTATIWIQSDVSGTFTCRYRPVNASHSELVSLPSTSLASKAFTAQIQLGGLVPNTRYEYDVLVASQVLSSGSFQTPPPAGYSGADPLKIAFGSCVYINDSTTDRRYKGGEYELFEAIAEQGPQLMFWLGDNIYLRPQDWSTEEGFAYRYSHTRQLPEMQALLANTAHYAIWDDHDYGPNDSDRSFVGKEIALKWFNHFWANPPSHPAVGGIATAFSWGDVDFFLTDNRSFRSPQKRSSGNRTVLGEVQREWLVDALAFSEAKVKVVVMGGLFLSSMDNPLSQNYIVNYAEERQWLLDELEANGINNVIFLTGDKHFSEVSSMALPNGNQLYEFASSPLTANVNTRDDINVYRLPGSHIQQRNFGLLTISKDLLTIKFLDSQGQTLYIKNITIN
ncbi:alkaline phosphatase D family protein [Marinoscillum furvescens]|uniref:Alkaline phosphatase D n=1 Tax=Marinoscillum furvescens DSM 4134 TaxID=1122208 RepID=A0A3D9L046_MARFU|nr:alkaline phosphatase D family protein [Marinoscillum furvescens]RED96566.1 alkaline phosphatase D [Marinoscillum furvescens DSM 4134]